MAKTHWEPHGRQRTLGLVVMNKIGTRLEGTHYLTNITSASLRKVADLWKVIRREHTHTHRITDDHFSYPSIFACSFKAWNLQVWSYREVPLYPSAPLTSLRFWVIVLEGQCQDFAATLTLGWFSFPELPSQVLTPEPQPIILLLDAFRRVLRGQRVGGRITQGSGTRRTRLSSQGTSAQPDTDVKARNFLHVAQKRQVPFQSSGSPPLVLWDGGKFFRSSNNSYCRSLCS